MSRLSAILCTFLCLTLLAGGSEVVRADTKSQMVALMDKLGKYKADNTALVDWEHLTVNTPETKGLNIPKMYAGLDAAGKKKFRVEFLASYAKSFQSTSGGHKFSEVAKVNGALTVGGKGNHPTLTIHQPDDKGDLKILFVKRGAKLLFVGMERLVSREAALGDTFINAVIERKAERIEQMLASRPELALIKNNLGNPIIVFSGGTAFSPKIAELLLENGAEIDDCGPIGITALYLSVVAGNLEATTWFLEHGANPNATNNKGQTALHDRAKAPKPNLEVIRLMVSKGADLQLKDNEGHTAYDIAMMGSNQEMQEILKPR